MSTQSPTQKIPTILDDIALQIFGYKVHHNNQHVDATTFHMVFFSEHKTQEYLQVIDSHATSDKKASYTK